MSDREIAVQDSRIRVSFYVLEAADPAARLDYACRLTEKAYRLRHRVHAHAESPAEARELDELLWTFRQGSFVPHEIAPHGTGNGGTPTAPVTIGCGASAPPEADLLVNLARDVPEFFGRFGRIAEIVDGTPEGREAGRSRHQFYRQQGLEPETHRIAADGVS